jgi:hypothetical protein
MLLENTEGQEIPIGFFNRFFDIARARAIFKPKARIKFVQ